MVRVETDLIKSWKLKIGILMAVIVPSVTVTAGVYNIKASIEERITQVKIESRDTYVKKDEMRELRNDVKELRDKLDELKILLLRHPR